MTLEEAKFFFQQDKFATCAAGIVLKELDENGAVCTMTITDNHLNAVGSVMGGALFTLADFGFAAAANFKGMGLCLPLPVHPLRCSL